MTVVRIALTPGDPSGIGPEVGVAALSMLGARADLSIVAIGDEALWRRAADLRGVDWDALDVDPCVPPSGLERVSLPGGPAWLDLPEVAAIVTAVDGCLAGRYDAVCTGPIHKASLLERGFPHPGHTGFLAVLCGLQPDDAVMVFGGGQLIVALATTHLPLAQVPRRLDAAAIVRAARAGEAVARSLGRGPTVRTAVCGLNPHAGEGGLLGQEEQQVVAPAVAQLREEGREVTGPWPADTLFGRAAGGEFDLVVALYHDQGLIPVKTLDFGRSVNITAGLPLVRTSVDHGTARDIAWTGQADPRPTVAALEMAARLVVG